MGQIVDRAVVLYERESFFHRLAFDFEALSNDEEAHAEYLRERETWSTWS